MSNFERINSPRIEKVLKMLEVIETSAKSNRVQPDELAALLHPVLMRLSGNGAASAPTPKAKIGNERRDIALWEEAQKAPLDELMMAYSTITSRLVNLVDEHK